jgi:PKHD-type hydroxylase
LKIEDAYPAYTWALEIKNIQNYAFWVDSFTEEECEKICQAGEKEFLFEGQVQQEILTNDDKFRRSKISWLRSNRTENNWIFERLTRIINSINRDFFNFDLDQIENLQYGIYDSSDQGFYTKHIDMMPKSAKVRKLSFSLQLTNSLDYEGGDLVLHYKSDPEIASRTQGTITFFPSYTLHEVTPVTKGIRRSLVGWITGPAFK